MISEVQTKSCRWIYIGYPSPDRGFIVDHLKAWGCVVDEYLKHDHPDHLLAATVAIASYPFDAAFLEPDADPEAYLKLAEVLYSEGIPFIWSTSAEGHHTDIEGMGGAVVRLPGLARDVYRAIRAEFPDRVVSKMKLDRPVMITWDGHPDTRVWSVPLSGR